MTEISSRIAAARITRGYTITGLAFAARLGPAQLCRYEAGAATPSIPILVRIATTLEVSLDYLAGVTDEMASAGLAAEATLQALGRLQKGDTVLVDDIIRILERRSATP